MHGLFKFFVDIEKAENSYYTKYEYRYEIMHILKNLLKITKYKSKLKQAIKGNSDL